MSEKGCTSVEHKWQAVEIGATKWKEFPRAVATLTAGVMSVGEMDRERREIVLFCQNCGEWKR